MHIGLHKTGTTSFQNACFRESPKLADKGILYPISDDLTRGTVQHLALPSLLRSEKSLSKPVSIFRSIFSESRDADILLISSEDFSTFFGSTEFETRSQEFLDWVDVNFDQADYFCVIRDELDLLRSVVIQTIEGEGFPLNGDAFVERLAKRMFEKCTQIKKMLGPRLHVVKYETIPDESFASILLSTMINKEISLKEYKSNVTGHKDVLRIVFGAALRRMLMNSLGADHLYAKDVNAAWSGILNRLHPDKLDKIRLVGLLDDWVAKMVTRERVMSAGSVSLDQIFAENLTQVSR